MQLLHFTDRSNLTGSLTGRGAATVLLRANVGRVPDVAPAALADHVELDLDNGGHPYDWRLSPAVATADVRATFQVWRSGFICERFVGEAAFVDSVLDWAGHIVDASALHILRLAGGHVSIAGAIRLSWLARRLTEQCATRAETGFGVVTNPTLNAAGRALLPRSSPTTLLAIEGTELRLNCRGATLHDGDSQAISIGGWERTPDGARLTTPDHSPARVSEPAAVLLDVLGRRSARAQIKVMPLQSLTATMFSAITDLARTAVDAGTGLQVRIAPQVMTNDAGGHVKPRPA